MISENTITVIADVMAVEQRDKVVNNIGEALRGALGTERISEQRIERILGKFIEELKK